MTITIDGIELTSAQALAVRVALVSMWTNMSEPGALGNDAHGRTMAKAYVERASEVVALIDGVSGQSPKG
jgi:hypothetical protein